MEITLHYTDESFIDHTKVFDLSSGTEFNTFLAKLDAVSHFHNTTNTIWRIYGVKDSKDCILGYFVTDRNKHHKYATPFEKLQLTQLGSDLYASEEKFESLNVDSLDFLNLFNELKEHDLVAPKKSLKEIKKLDRIISTPIVFGCGYRVVSGEKQFYAWHGLANKNDNYITTAEISESEFRMIEKEYPFPIDAKKEQASAFRKKYVHNHKILLEGWHKYI